MFRSSSKKKQTVIDNAVNQINQDTEEVPFTNSLEANVDIIKELFKDVDIIVTKFIKSAAPDSYRYCIIYCQGMIDDNRINDNIIKPLQLSLPPEAENTVIKAFMEQIIQIDDIVQTGSVSSVVEAISYGNTVLFAENEKEALILDTKSFSTRAISEPENERTLNGPREGFTEAIMTNLSMLRRRVRTNKLKMKLYTIGKRTKTQTCICYMDGIVNEKILAELYKRLKKIDIDAVLDTNYISELIKDSPHSPFRTTGYTERPDTVIARLLEGRIALIVDGSPSVMTLPFLFVENFQSSEDYYMNFYYASFSRFLRIFGFFLTLVVPGLFIAIVAYHQEMLPTQLLLNITVERQGAPLPASVEAFVMLIIFDILRETGVRMPSNIGQALSIVGALVIGQSAVEAKMVAAPMIIVVALTGITNLLVPRLSGPVIYIRYFFLFAASIFGFYGLALAMTAVVIHMLNLRSFGIPQISAAGSLRFQEVKDTVLRAPWFKMQQRRPKNLTKNRTRLRTGGDTM